MQLTAETAEDRALSFPVVTWKKLVKDHREAGGSGLNSKLFAAKHYKLLLHSFHTSTKGSEI
jgi:hypothetical protein